MARSATPSKQRGGSGRVTGYMWKRPPTRSGDVVPGADASKNTGVRSAMVERALSAGQGAKPYLQADYWYAAALAEEMLAIRQWPIAIQHACMRYLVGEQFDLKLIAQLFGTTEKVVKGVVLA